MCCDDFREKISVMIDEALSEEDRTLVTEHLAACPECMQVFEAFSALSACLGELEEPPEGLRDAVMEIVRVQARRPVWRKTEDFRKYRKSLKFFLVIVKVLCYSSVANL